MGLINKNGELDYTLGETPPFINIPNITAQLQYPMFVDHLYDGYYIVSNIGNKCLYKFNPDSMNSELLIGGDKFGMKDMGNCVVDNEGNIWINEVEGCRIWKYDDTGKPALTLGDGTSGFNKKTVSFDESRFSWVYDIRKGPNGNIYVLDSKNFAVRVIDVVEEKVKTIAGNGSGGFSGDGGKAEYATFGSNPEKYFDGPFSLSVDEDCNVFVGDRYNHVLRMIEGETGMITSIAGDPNPRGTVNDPNTIDPLNLQLPMISSMDYYNGRIFLPTDLPDNVGDLIILKKSC